MPTLLVMRHAKSAWDTGETDHERPLNARGRRQSLEMGEWIQEEYPHLDLVLCSTSKRTRQTLARVQEGSVEAADVQFRREIYEAGVFDVLPLLLNVADGVETVLLLGHFPGVADLVDHLVGDDGREASGEFVTSGVAVLTFEEAWSELRPGSATLTAFEIPTRRRD